MTGAVREYRGDVIAALSTGWGYSARALVRLSGAKLMERVGGVVEMEGGGEGSSARRMGAARVRLSEEGMIRVLAMYAPGPGSFTGEDVLELMLPGSPRVVERVLKVLCACEGVRAAEAGEFSARAFLNGRMTLEQAEGVSAVIAAGSEAELQAAQRVMSGRTGERYRGWSEELARLLALVEAGIDFTDQEDVVPIERGVLRARLENLRVEILGELGGAQGGEYERHQRRVVLMGRPNAGKSTLFNALLGRRRAVTSALAGTTRDVIAEDLELGGGGMGAGVVTLMDAAGVDERIADGQIAGKGREIERAAQERARAVACDADVVVWCDPSGAFREGELGTGTWRAAVIRVRTKADLNGAELAGGASAPPGGAELAGGTPAPPGGAPPGDMGELSVCALDGWHLGALKRAIADACFGARDAAGVCPVARHRRTLSGVVDRLSGALSVLNAGEARAIEHVELVAGELRGAMDLAGELTGAVTPDDVIGRVFATFCVGK